MVSIPLSVKDRFSVLGLLPEKGGLVTMLVSKDLRSRVELTQSDISEINLVVNGANASWDDTKEKPLVLELTEAELQVLKDAVEEADKSGNITIHNVDMCSRIKALSGK